MSGTGIRSKSGGAVGGTGTLFLAPNRPNSGSPFLPLQQEQPPPPDAWDHFQGDEIELVAIPSTTQAKNVSAPGDAEDPWPWDDPADDEWTIAIDDADDAVGDAAPSTELSTPDPWDHWEPDPDVVVIESGTQQIDVDRPPDEIEWPWSDGQEFDGDWPLLVFDSAPVGPNSGQLSLEDAWDHWAEEIELGFIPGTAQLVSSDRVPDEIEWPWADGLEFDYDWQELAAADSAPVGADTVVVPGTIDDPWDHWSEETELLVVLGSAQAFDVAPPADSADPWTWDDAFDDDWPAIIDDDDDGVGADAPSTATVVEDPWYWDDDSSELEDFGTDPVGANVDPVQEDPWYWDDSFDDEAGIDFDQPLGANVAPVPEDPIWDWSECVSDDDAFDLAQPVGANVSPSPEDIEWPWADGHEQDEDWPALTFESAPVGANVDPVPEDPWDWSEYPDDDGALDFDQPQPIDVPQTVLPPEDPWDWSEFPDDDAALDFDQPLGANVDPSTEDPWLWDDSLEDEWEGSTSPVSLPDLPTYQDDWYWEEVEDEWQSIIDDDDDAIGTALDTTSFQHEWDWEEAEDEWQAIIDDGDDAIGLDAIAGSLPEDPWDWYSEEIETLALTTSYQTDTALPGSPLLAVEDGWDHFAEEIALVAIPVTRQQSPPLPPSLLLANSDENFHFYIGDVEHFHADHFDNYDSDNAIYDHEWLWEEVEDESYQFSTDPIRTNALLFAPAPDEPWPHFEDLLGYEELEYLVASAPVGRDLEPPPDDAWEWTEDTGDELAALAALDQPQPPPDPNNIEDAWPWWDDTGEETGDFEALASDFDISHAPIAIDDPWRWFDDEVDESPLFAALDAQDNFTIPASRPPEDPPWDWSEAVEDPEPDPQHPLVDIIPDVPTIGDESGSFDWPAEDTMGDEPTLYGNAPVGPDGCPSCANTAKRWFGPTFVKFLQ